MIRPIQIAFSPLAQEDLDAIYAYTALSWGAMAADAYISTIQNAVDGLRFLPDRGARYDNAGIPLRWVISGKHRIFYFPEPDVLQILRIIHERENVEKVNFGT